MNKINDLKNLRKSESRESNQNQNLENRYPDQDEFINIEVNIQ
jgi:hypothetical protein